MRSKLWERFHHDKQLEKKRRQYLLQREAGTQGLQADTLMATDRGTLMENKKVQVVHLQMVKDDEIAYGSRRMDNPREAAELMKDFLGDVDRECLVVCGTDVKMKPVYIQTVAMGSVSCCPVSIPDIFKGALLANALNLLLFHNHLSGDVTPSRDDLLMTERVRQSGELLGIHLLDHIILGDRGEFYSLREDGRCFGQQEDSIKN